MDKIINAREKLEELINLVDTRIMSDIGDFIDNLTEEESKLILRMLVYGDWKKLDR